MFLAYPFDGNYPSLMGRIRDEFVKKLTFRRFQRLSRGN
jgi:hypothetical protein